MTPEQVAEVLDRSAQGEGVVNVLRDLGLEIYESLEYLKRYHNDDIIAAKQVQREEMANRVSRETLKSEPLYEG